ncbi:P-loop containing nucleoside triphosphate hydrolase protein [Elsinoe ampelina]|uniref:P-loop containing nucleoside triphosphate hydrolase protein n=1 Tax=Elsinoe ampelina TaxID=302913 RepID=A0A6A6FY51_9PEZI|nr:P-loop containing nucleoside triphosphate hydrolase protein [Elsinoe ampelina]
MSRSSKVLLVGISGVSSSGKTTLSRLLRDIIPDTFILHEDDFYKTDTEIPFSNGVQDWDCLESLDLPAMEAALRHIKEHGTSPPGLVSKEDRNSVGEVNIDQPVIQKLKKETLERSQNRDDVKVAIVDGFLLFAEEMKNVRDLFDVKLFLRTDYQTAKGRREARKGYVTLEGFWEDPPGYVDKIVWPNYVKDHAFLFEDGNVEGKVKEDLCASLGIEVMPDTAQGDMTACLQWAYASLDKARTKLK